MNQARILVGSVTFAIQGRDILRARGMRAYIERGKGPQPQYGCGYSIRVDGDGAEAQRILQAHHIKVLGRVGADGA